MLFCTSAQRPLHASWPAGQFATQAPRSQIWPAAQALPQAPQLLRSIWGFVQKRTPPASAPPSPPPPHCARPAPHSSVQRPMEHTSPAAQAVPQAPQLARSVCRSTQRPLHAACPVGQPIWHCPATHTWVRAQAVPQAPQWSALDCVSTHAPPQARWGATQVTSIAASMPPSALMPPTTGESVQPVATAIAAMRKRIGELRLIA